MEKKMQTSIKGGHLGLRCLGSLQAPSLQINDYMSH